MSDVAVYGSLFEASPNPYVLVSPSLTIVGCNDAYLRVTARTRADIVGRGIFDAFPGGPNEAQLRSSFDRVLRTKERDSIAVIPYAIAKTTPEGTLLEERFWSATHTPVLDARGDVRLILQHTVDVTELHRLKQAVASGEGTAEALDAAPGPIEQIESDLMRRAQAVQRTNLSLDAELERLHSLFTQAPGFIAVLSGPDHVFDLANDAYYDLIGRRDILGKPIHEALPEIEGQGFHELLDRVFESRQAFVGRDMRLLLRPDPDSPPAEFFLDFVYQPVLRADGGVLGIFVQGHDVTNRKRAQDELLRYQTDLEALVRERTLALEKSEAERAQAEAALRQAQRLEAIGKLTGGVAHDFNNLLQVIGSNLDLLHHDLPADPATTTRRLDSAMGAVQRGARLASQLLAFARKQPLEPRPVSLGRLLRGMDDLLRRALGDEVEVETVIAGGLWSMLADPSQVENVILNLAINARDAMDGSGRLTLEAGNAMLDDFYALRHPEVTAGQYVMLGVSDTGCGMSAEVMERAFEPFFTTKPEGKGTGMGLAMVHGFVKQSGGHVKIYSEVGHGTTVKIYLPRSHQVAEEPVTDPRTGPVAGGTETILVVEDDPQVRAATVEILTGLGYRVLQAGDAQSALAVIRSGVLVDLLFTDVVMPGTLRSPELARRARETLPDLAVLFTSGYTENAIVHGGRLDPGVHLLSKPYRREDLARKIRHLLGNQRQRRIARPGPSAATPMPPPIPPFLASAVQPLGAPTMTKTLAQQPMAPRVLAEEAGTGCHVLLVEDDGIIQASTMDMLESLGHTVTAAADADEAMVELGRGGIDVLFTDIGLPGRSGIELAHEALAHDPTLRVIVASGYGGDIRDGGSEAGLDAVFLPKPYNRNGIRKAFQSLPQPPSGKNRP
ncbi:histidine kinase [Skermanella stibiiresistens SB22]|uniref:histidine kinase n=1 Tax=Skermanella stibiiresistens SB22 TaxID=1385369 RepID=W9H2Q6_9PROT|nr:histidine kinase [Skermanella stibiiresistens SB22]